MDGTIMKEEAAGLPPGIQRVTVMREGPQNVAQQLAVAKLRHRIDQLAGVDGGESLCGPAPSPSIPRDRLGGPHRVRRLALCGGREEAKACSSTYGPPPRPWCVGGQLLCVPRSGDRLPDRAQKLSSPLV